MEDPQFQMTVVSRRRSSEEADAEHTHHHSHSSGEHRHSHSGTHHHSSSSGKHRHGDSGEHRHSHSGEHHHSHSGEHHHSQSSGSRHHHSSSHRYQDYGTVNLGSLTEQLDRVIDQEDAPESLPVPEGAAPAAADDSRDVMKKYGPILTRKYRKRHGPLATWLVVGVFTVLLLALLIFFVQQARPEASDSATFSPVESPEEIFDQR